MIRVGNEPSNERHSLSGMTVDELMAELHTMIVTHGCGGDQVVVDIDYQSETVTVPIVAVESFDVGVGLVPGPRSRALARQRNAR